MPVVNGRARGRISGNGDSSRLRLGAQFGLKVTVGNETEAHLIQGPQWPCLEDYTSIIELFMLDIRINSADQRRGVYHRRQEPSPRLCYEFPRNLFMQVPPR